MVDHTARVDAIVATPPFSRVSWGGIIAGTVCALAVQLLLNLLGLGIGLATVDLADAPGSVAEVGIGAGLWWGLSAIIALITGGWVAARLAGVPIRTTAILHGFAVWALATLLAVWLATTTLATAVSGAFGAVGHIGQATAQAVGGSVQAARTIDLPNLDLPRLASQTELTDAVAQRESVRQSIRDQARELARQVVSRQEQQAAVSAVENTARDIARTPGDAGAELNALVDTLISANGVFGQEDRQEVIALMENRLGVSPQEAETIVANWEERYQQAVAQVDEAVETLQTQARQTAGAAVDAVGAAAGWTALALFLGLLAAIGGGVLGKPEPWMVEAAEDR